MEIVSCMKCQRLFSGEILKIIRNLSYVEFALRVVKVKGFIMAYKGLNVKHTQQNLYPVTHNVVTTSLQRHDVAATL